MGSWGAGLYAGDFAQDLRSTVRAVSRLPFDGDRLVELLAGLEPAAGDSDDGMHTTFWLVVADQFARRGIASDRARGVAIDIIDRGADIGAMRSLGMGPAALRARAKELRELRARLTAAPAPGRQRTVLRRPQPFVMEVGDVFVYPTSGNDCINSYLPPGRGQPGWLQDGWGIAVAVDRGRTFGYLSWYRPVVAVRPFADRPDHDTARTATSWRLRSPGTCSPVHFKRLRLERIGSFTIDVARLRSRFTGMPSGDFSAINDISIANSLSLRRPLVEVRANDDALHRLAEVIAG